MEVFLRPIYSTEQKTEKGTCQEVDIAFTWHGNLCRTPALYLFQEGIVLDVFERIDGERVREYVTHAMKIEGRTEDLPQGQREILVRNNPFQGFHIEKMRVNGKNPVEYIGNSVIIYAEEWQKKIIASGFTRDVQQQLIGDWKREYSFLKDDESYSVHRYVYFVENYNREIAEKLEITIAEKREVFPIQQQITLPVGVQDKNTKIDFVDPMTQKEQSIFINEVLVQDTKEFRVHDREFPPYAIFLKIELPNHVLEEDDIIVEHLNRDENRGKNSVAFGVIFSSGSEKEIGLNGYSLQMKSVGCLTYMPDEVVINFIGIERKMGGKTEQEWEIKKEGNYDV